MPSPKSEAAKNLANFLSESQAKKRVYHGTSVNEDFEKFKKGPRWIHFSENPDEASRYALEIQGQRNVGESPRVIPAYLQAKRPLVIDESLNTEMSFVPYKQRQKELIEIATQEGKDSIYNPFTGTWMVQEPTQIKSAIGNRGTFDPTNPDITKAKGGQVNPFKSPREILFEMAGIPSFSSGKATAGAEMYKLITQAIERYTQKFGRAPSPEDVQALKQHAKELSQKAEIKTDPATQARARHEMATDPNLINPEGPDPFLTKAMTGRTVKGTYIKPKVQDINDPNVRANIETKQMAGELEDIMPESITPSADYFGRTSKAIENEALASGSPPMIDKLKAAFFAKNKRYPTDEELEIIIAEFNPSRHQYGTMGDLVVGERPPTASGMAEWKQKARTEGVPEVYLEESPRKYPKYLQDALNLSRGVQPGTKPLSNARINPDRSYANGSAVAAMTPREMQAAMLANNVTPSQFEDPYQKALEEARKKGNPNVGETRMEKILRRANAPVAVMSGMAAADALSQGQYVPAALQGATAVGSALGTTKKFFSPGIKLAGAAAVPLSLDEAYERYKAGDRTGAVIATIQAAGNAMMMYPPTAIPGFVIGTGAGIANAMRD